MRVVLRSLLLALLVTGCAPKSLLEGDPVDPVEHQAAGTFEKVTVRFVMRQVHDLSHLKAQFRIEAFDDVQAPFAAAVLRLHRVEHDRPVRVKADPVVGKDRIGRVRFGRIVEHDDIDACVAQSRRQFLEFRQCCALLLGRRQVGLGLESIRFRRLRIALEALRPDHQDAGCQL